MRMSKKEIISYMRWMVSEHAPVCQRCGEASTDDAHHLRYGAYKDDRYLVSVCRPCHEWFHQNKRKGIDAYESVAIENYEIYQKEEHVI